MQREVWVWVQHRLGEPNPIAAEAMTAGEALAARADARLACVAVGWGAREVFRGGVARGAEVVYAVDDPILRNNMDNRRLAASLIHLIQERRPLAILFDGSVTGQHIAARIAAGLGVTMVGEATGLTYKDGAVVQQCPLFGNSIITEVTSRDETAVVILRPGAWAQRRPERGRTGTLVEVEPPQLPPVGVVIDDVLVEQPPVAAAGTQILVVSGKGDRELGAWARDLAQAMGGRWVTVDEWGMSWAPQMADPAGSTTPVLYIALGVAGAFRRRAGSNMQETIVAVHADPDAPIFKTATYGIVAEPQEVAAALLQQVAGSTPVR